MAHGPTAVLHVSLDIYSCKFRFSALAESRKAEALDRTGDDATGRSVFTTLRLVALDIPENLKSLCSPIERYSLYTAVLARPYSCSTATTGTAVPVPRYLPRYGRTTAVPAGE